MKMIRRMDKRNKVMGEDDVRGVGIRAKSRPTKSPVFQTRKASGMKTGGWSSRGIGVEGYTLSIFCVKMGKYIVMMKQIDTASASQRSLRKRVHIDTCFRCGVDRSSDSSSASSSSSLT